MKKLLIIVPSLFAGALIAALGADVSQHRFPSEVTIQNSDGTFLTVTWMWAQTMATAINMLYLLVPLGIIIGLLSLVGLFRLFIFLRPQPTKWDKLIPSLQIAVGLLVVAIGVYTVGLPYPVDVVRPVDSTMEIIYRYPDAEVTGAINLTYVIVLIALASAAASLWWRFQVRLSPTEIKYEN